MTAEVRDITRIGGRVVDGRLPVFMAAGWLPVPHERVSVLEAARVRLAGPARVARAREAAIVELRERFAGEDAARAAAIREAAVSGLEGPVAEVTPLDVRDARIGVAWERFAAAVEEYLGAVLEVAQLLGTGAGRGALLDVANRGMNAPAAQRELREDGAAMRALLAQLEELTVHVPGGEAHPVGRVRRLVSPGARGRVVA